MMNWYLVRGGEIKTRYGDAVPVSYMDPASGAQVDLISLSAEKLAAAGWLQGAAQDMPPFDPKTQKCYIVPEVPKDLAAWQESYKASAAAGDAAAAAMVIASPAPKVIEQWVVESLTDAELAAVKAQAFAGVKSQRAALLQRTDYLMLPDAPIDDATRKLWIAYRQQLRDLTTRFADPRDVVWPTLPGNPDLGF